MAYRVELSADFEKSLAKLPRETARRILTGLREVENLEDSRSRGKALTGPLRGLWRYRMGDYRVVCDIRDDVLVVVALRAGHRREVYRKLR